MIFDGSGSPRETFGRSARITAAPVADPVSRTIAVQTLETGRRPAIRTTWYDDRGRTVADLVGRDASRPTPMAAGGSTYLIDAGTIDLIDVAHGRVERSTAMPVALSGSSPRLRAFGDALVVEGSEAALVAPADGLQRAPETIRVPAVDSLPEEASPQQVEPSRAAAPAATRGGAPLRPPVVVRQMGRAADGTRLCVIENAPPDEAAALAAAVAAGCRNPDGSRVRWTPTPAVH